VVRIGNGLSGFTVDGDKIIVGAGCWVPRLALVAARHGLSGLEHTIGIPASLGGLVCMNGGSQRKNIGELIESVQVLTPEGALRTDPVSVCGFGYRKSRYQSSSDIILSATLQFERMRPYAEQRFEMLKILRERSRKFPRKLPSCGSVFKSSPELYEAYGTPGKIIEDLGFKGQTCRRIQVSPSHANFIVNLGGGCSSDVLGLVREIHAAVLTKTGISMQPEFLYVDSIKGPIGVL
jgi:UDP-N-acetylmuramate dehydrogenase